MELRKILTWIDNYYSRIYHLRMLIFLAQAVVPYEQLQTCGGVPEVYDKILASIGDSESTIAVALLRYMLHVTGYKREKELKQLDEHCSEELNLPSRFPSLLFFERLLVLSSKLLKGKRFDRFWSSVDEDKLNKSKLDVKSSPLDLFQSMIYKRTLDPKNYNTIVEEVVPLLEQCEMNDETQFLRFLESTPQTTANDMGINTQMYFTFKGECPRDPDCMRPLLTSRVELKSWRSSCLISTERKDRCIRVLFALAFVCAFISATLLFFAMPSGQPEYTQTQLFYGLGTLTYSPFPNTSIDRYYYNRMNVTAIVPEEDDFEKFNISVCSMPCPIPVSERILSVTGYRSNNLANTNYYVNLRNWPSPDSTIDAQNFALYMLEGSSLTFIITRLAPLTDVQLCVTDSVDVCGEVYNNETESVKARQVCLELLTFNKTNSDHIRVFTVKNTSYYCAVWILRDNNQLLNYTVNITHWSYVLTDSRPPSLQCQTHQKQTKIQSFDLRPRIAFKRPDPVCIAVRVAGVYLHDNITLESTVVTSKFDNITFVLGAMFGGFNVVAIVCMFVMLMAC